MQTLDVGSGWGIVVDFVYSSSVAITVMNCSSQGADIGVLAEMTWRGLWEGGCALHTQFD